jgi:hypothetical protein
MSRRFMMNYTSPETRRAAQQFIKKLQETNRLEILEVEHEILTYEQEVPGGEYAIQLDLLEDVGSQHVLEIWIWETTYNIYYYYVNDPQKLRPVALVERLISHEENVNREQVVQELNELFNIMVQGKCLVSNKSRQQRH